jgi:hypothetical protein
MDTGLWLSPREDLHSQRGPLASAADLGLECFLGLNWLICKMEVIRPSGAASNELFLESSLAIGMVGWRWGHVCLARDSAP